MKKVLINLLKVSLKTEPKPNKYLLEFLYLEILGKLILIIKIGNNLESKPKNQKFVAVMLVNKATEQKKECRTRVVLYHLVNYTNKMVLNIVLIKIQKVILDFLRKIIIK